MNILNKSILCIMLGFVFTMCNNKSDNPKKSNISYPSNVLYGNNILSFKDSSFLVDEADYELGAVLEKNAELTIKITNYPQTNNLAQKTTIWYYHDEVNYTVSDYDETAFTQFFNSNKSGKISTSMQFFAYGLVGKCKIECFENGESTPKITKILFWQ